MSRLTLIALLLCLPTAVAAQQPDEAPPAEPPTTLPEDDTAERMAALEARIAATQATLEQQGAALDAARAKLDAREAQLAGQEKALADRVASANVEPPRSKNRIKTQVELGFLDVLSHRIQFGEAGTYFDYVDEGAQDLLFFFTRLGLNWTPNGRHHLGFLYQPIKIEGSTVLQRDILVEDVVFAAGTTLNTTYGFPFYRLSYMYDVAPSEDLEIALGGSLQIRDATIIFESGDGTQRVARRDVGPVPILKARLRKNLSNDYFVGAEADGFYAPISYLNGSDSEVVGAILDASLRVGRTFADGKMDMYLNARYLGGGAVGASDDYEGTGDDGYVKNWLHFATISVGVDFDWTDGF